MTPAERIQEVLQHADAVIQKAQSWATNDKLPNSVPDDLAAAIENSELINHQGDIPQSCQELIWKLSTLAENQRKYDAGHEDCKERNGEPTQRWWASMREVIKARSGAEGVRHIRMESVKDLLEQKVSRMQIAGSIYGRRGSGPLMQSNGIPDDFLIDKEAATPGSVLIGWPDWIPPWEQEIQRQQRLKVQGQLTALEKRSEPRQYTDPATIEEMLKDGCYVQQIEKGKHVSREVVLEAAAKLGIKPVDQPGWVPESVLGSEVGDPQAKSTSDADKEKIRERVLEIWRENEQSIGAPDIVAKLREEGLTASANSIGTILSWERRKASGKPETAGVE